MQISVDQHGNNHSHAFGSSPISVCRENFPSLPAVDLLTVHYCIPSHYSIFVGSKNRRLVSGLTPFTCKQSIDPVQSGGNMDGPGL